jgi:hypothetical protein
LRRTNRLFLRTLRVGLYIFLRLARGFGALFRSLCKRRHTWPGVGNVQAEPRLSMHSGAFGTVDLLQKEVERMRLLQP